MTITNELKIKGDRLQNEITNYKYDTTNFSELYGGQYSAYLLQDDIYTIRIVDYGNQKCEYGFTYFSRIEIKNDKIFKKWYPWDTNHFGDSGWVSWIVTNKPNVIKQIKQNLFKTK